ncbi:MAG: TraB/GumN family protein [Prevotellaceae bacterium]|jgi:uncharacterized protein YbaP (TraB family)|nr:TraB/GumN family protein [Prevotellaceae bacterium]
MLINCKPPITNSLLWKIEKEGSLPSFLFGTIHVYDPEVFRIPEILYQLIDSVDIYSPEADNRNVSASEMLSRFVVRNPPDYSLKNYFNDENYANILNLSKIDADILDKCKPFFVASMVLNEEKMPVNSIDSELLRYAASIGKPVYAMESVEEQIDAIDAIPFEEQAAIITESFMNLDAKNDFETIMNDYKEQNLRALEESLKKMNPTQLFTEFIQTKRNIVMSNKIDWVLSEGQSLFVAVGALHLPDTQNAKGVVSLLREKGYSMQPVEFSFVTEF